MNSKKVLLASASVVFLAPLFAEQSPSDVDLQHTVELRILTLRNYSIFDSGQATIEKGSVTLNGQVTSEKVKEEAVKAVGDVKGVANVVDAMSVLAASTKDDGLRLALYDALRSETTLIKYLVAAVPKLHLIVNTGSVIVQGTVFSQVDAERISAIARSITGIVEVKNELKITP